MRPKIEKELPKPEPRKSMLPAPKRVSKISKLPSKKRLKSNKQLKQHSIPTKTNKKLTSILPSPMKHSSVTIQKSNSLKHKNEIPKITKIAKIPLGFSSSVPIQSSYHLSDSNSDSDNKDNDNKEQNENKKKQKNKSNDDIQYDEYLRSVFVIKKILKLKLKFVEDKKIKIKDQGCDEYDHLMFKMDYMHIEKYHEDWEEYFTDFDAYIATVQQDTIKKRKSSKVKLTDVQY